MPSPRSYALPLRAGGAMLGMALALFAVGSPLANELTQAAQERRHMFMTVGTKRFAVTLDDNPTAHAFVQLLPTTIDMADLNGNEKHAILPRRLPTQPVPPGTIRSGDVMLYGNDTLVVFYETFRSSYSYTRIGRIDDSAGLSTALGSGKQRIAFTAQ